MSGQAALADTSKNTIRQRAAAFSKSWAGVTSERAESQTFWNEFFAVFGVERRRFAAFENIAKRSSSGKPGRMDVLWPGELGVEHKSGGKSLGDAMDQLVDYLPSLPKAEHPWLLVVSDFARFNWRNLETGDAGEFALEELGDHLDLFWWMAGHDKAHEQHIPEEEVNLKATALLAVLYDELTAAGYDEHALRQWLTRIVFCLFADDTAVWDPAAFLIYLTQNTRIDGSDLGRSLGELFEVLNTPDAKRQSTLDEDLKQFTYINGDLFADPLPTPACTEAVRTALLGACRFDWSKISPAIFGSMFQNVMTAPERRALGAHYTTEQNILRTIEPLFLDDLKAELDAAKTKPALERFHVKLEQLTFFDPACGCGNFLVIAYREIRHLETECLRRLDAKNRRSGQLRADLALLCRVDVSQFFGIEIEEFPARIARTALYLMDHIANREVSAEFGQHYVRFPIPAAPNIVLGNALDLDWNTVLEASKATYVFGNPPFVGKKMRDDAQQADMERVFQGAKSTGILDYVTAWYQVAARYIDSTDCRVAFVSTNSISQGEQVPALWHQLELLDVAIDFAHRTFAWTSEASGKAHVHVVIIGFSQGGKAAKKQLFEYPDINKDPTVITASNINAYLADATNVLVDKRRTPLVSVPAMRFGSMPNDDGNLLVDDDAVASVRADVIAAKYLRALICSHEELHGEKRWCLWLTDADPHDLTASPELNTRLTAVRTYRLASKRATTVGLASTPSLFGEIRQPTKRYLFVPRHSSQTRTYVPVAFMDPKQIAHDSTMTIENADDYLFGVLCSARSTLGCEQSAAASRTTCESPLKSSTTTSRFPTRATSNAKQSRTLREQYLPHAPSIRARRSPTCTARQRCQPISRQRTARWTRR